MYIAHSVLHVCMYIYIYIYISISISLSLYIYIYIHMYKASWALSDKRSALWSLCHAFRGECLWMVVLLIAKETCYAIQAVLLTHLVSSLYSEAELVDRLRWAALMVCSSFCFMCFHAHAFYNMYLIGARMRAAAQALLFERCLLLPLPGTDSESPEAGSLPMYNILAIVHEFPFMLYLSLSLSLSLSIYIYIYIYTYGERERGLVINLFSSDLARLEYGSVPMGNLVIVPLHFVAISVLSVKLFTGTAALGEL